MYDRIRAVCMCDSRHLLLALAIHGGKSKFCYATDLFHNLELIGWTVINANKGAGMICLRHDSDSRSFWATSEFVCMSSSAFMFIWRA